jgi:hypothetical protein
MSFNVSLKVVNFEKEIALAKVEAEAIANKSLKVRIDFATELLKRVTPVKTGFARSRWKSKKYLLLSGGEIYNDASYIERLNRGSSTQAPSFFIEQSLMAAGII